MTVDEILEPLFMLQYQITTKQISKRNAYKVIATIEHRIIKNYLDDRIDGKTLDSYLNTTESFTKRYIHDWN